MQLTYELAAPIDHFTDSIIARLEEISTNPEQCECSSAESRKGACDQIPCYQDAVVYDLEDEQMKCLRCFEENQ